LGYDTLYDPDLDDHQLVRLARAQDRVLLTRDRELALRRGVRVLSIKSEDLDDQVRQVLTELELGADRTFSRCPICNERLEDLDREAARERVPPYVAQTRKTFRSCPKCRQVYWRGTHWQQMDEQLAHFRERGARPVVEEVTGPNST
jgi:uncharacterized protein with PIN domain